VTTPIIATRDKNKISWALGSERSILATNIIVSEREKEMKNKALSTKYF